MQESISKTYINEVSASGKSVSNATVVRIMDRLREQGMLVPNDSSADTTLRHEYRRVKRPLLSNAFGKSASLVDHGNLIMVTSSVPGEGKTYTCVNLALSMAQERDKSVLLVDCDVTKQGTSRMLGVNERRPDIVDLLVNENIPTQDALLYTDVPGLSVIPASQHHELITEMIASKRMGTVMSELATLYKDRLVLFDAPPVLSTPESQVLAGQVGQIVFVVEAGKTPYTIVQEALKMLPKEKAIGVVLNKSESLSNRGSYYYNYYKSYGEDD